MAVYPVENINKVDKTYYTDGDIFITKQRIAILHNNKMENLVKQSELRKIVREEIKKELKENE